MTDGLAVEGALVERIARVVMVGVGGIFVGLILACGGAGVPNERQKQPRESKPSLSPVAESEAEESEEPETNSPEAEPPARPKAASATKKTQPGPKVYQTGENFSVGYTSYRVDKVWWQDRLSSNQFLDRRANANWLFVQISVRNNDTKARMIPPFKLIDENRSEYEASPDGWRVEGSIGVLDSLNPRVTQHGFVVFDVPQGRTYRLIVSGGYWSTSEALVELKDDQALAQAEAERQAVAERKQAAAKAAELQRRKEAVEAAKWHDWKTMDGKYALHAKFISANPDVVKLEKEDGVVIEVPLKRLSQSDRDFIRRRPWVTAGK